MAIWGLCFKDGFDPDISAPNLPLIHAQCPPNLVQALRQSLGGGYPGRAGTASPAPSGPADGCTTNPLFAKLLGSQKPEMMMKMMMKIMLFHDVKWVNMKIRRLEDEEDSLFFFSIHPGIHF